MGPEGRAATCQPEFLEDLEFWIQQDRRVARRVLQLMREILRDPFQGAGHPEPLKYFGAGVWSRRITQEHRLVYRVSGPSIDFLQGRYHY